MGGRGDDAGERQQVDQALREDGDVHHPVHEVECVRDAAGIRRRRAILHDTCPHPEHVTRVSRIQDVAPHAERGEPGRGARERVAAHPAPPS